MLSLPPSSIPAREERTPLWAVLAPIVYLVACIGCVRAVALDPTTDYGVAALLVAVGLAPAFVLPAIFSTCPVRLSANEVGLVVNGRAEKLVLAQAEEQSRGAARLTVTTAAGRQRTFHLESIRDANALVAKLPPVSAPAGALAA